jgi:hypothetical protein
MTKLTEWEIEEKVPCLLVLSYKDKKNLVFNDLVKNLINEFMMTIQ